MRGAQQHLAGTGQAEGGDRRQQRHQQRRQRTRDLVRQAGARLVGRAPGGLELGDALLQRPIIELGRIDLGQRQLVGRDAGEARSSAAAGATMFILAS